MLKNLGLATYFLLMSLGLSAQVPRIVLNPQGHSGKIHNLLFTPDESSLISISEDKTIRMWDVRTGIMKNKFESQIGDGYEGMFYASALSPNGKLLAVAGYQVSTAKENYIIIIDIEKGIQVATAVGHSDVISGLSFSGSGEYLASGSTDGTVRIWKMGKSPNLDLVTRLDIGLRVTSVSFSRATVDLAVSCDESRDVLVFPLAGLRKGEKQFTAKRLQKHKGFVTKVAFSPDGSYLGSSSEANELILWNARGELIQAMDKLRHPVTAFAFSFDAKFLVTLDQTGKGTTFSIPKGNEIGGFAGHDNSVFSAVFSPSSTSNYMVASAGGSNNEILLWNPLNGSTIKRIKGKGSAIKNIAFGKGYELFVSKEVSVGDRIRYKASFDFSTLSVNKDPLQIPNTVQVPKEVIQTGMTTIQLPKGRVIETNVAIDGRILQYRALENGSVIVASDFSLKMFDKSGFLHKEFIGHQGSVRTISVSEDGEYLASGGEDQAIILWKLSEGGFAPSMRSVFESQGPEWAAYFSSLPVDSLTSQTTKKAWEQVIDFLKSNGQKAYKRIEAEYRSLGEIMIPYVTLFLADDYEWVCWSPSGYFSCSSVGSNHSGSKYFGWHINRGNEKLADYYSADQFFEILYRPVEMGKSVPEGKRVEDLLRESGERIFDLSKLHRPSAAFFEPYALNDSTAEVYPVDGILMTKENNIQLNVELFDGGAGFKEVNVFQNGKLTIRDTVLVSRGEGKKITRTYRVDLTSAENEFKVKVINYSKVESRADVLNIRYTGVIRATSSLYVLSVGINKYQNSIYNLNYAKSDATSFTDKITNGNSRIFKSIYKTEIYDTDATRQNILKGFESIIARAKPEDVFVFYYAGHGTLNEENGEHFYLVPTNVTQLYGDAAQLNSKAISGEELKNFFTLLKAQKQLMIMDACHSGAAVTAVASVKTRSAPSDEKAIATLARSSGIAILASSGTKQFASEFEQLAHGTFTYALLEALDGKADRGGDGLITVNEIKLFIDQRVPELTQQFGGKAQYPKGLQSGDDFPIFVME